MILSFTQTPEASSMKFSDLALQKQLLDIIEKKRYTEPTPIQVQAIPALLAGKDLIGIAQTGTGKTAAFLLPLIQKISGQNIQRTAYAPRALILAPTRELAAQIGDSCKTYSTYTQIKHTVVYGGVNQGPQVQSLQKGTDILIATPGRLIDLIEQKYIRLDHVTTFILDEADRMLDMGFVDDIRQLKPLITSNCQTAMFSATMSREIRSLAQDFLKNPVHVEIRQEDAQVKEINQELFYVEKNQKLELLLHLMKQDLNHVLIFTKTKAMADKVAKMLSKEKMHAEALHSDKSQAQRMRILEKFQKGKITLVATDIAARGIDVQSISHVINFDLPNDPENYIHRIGRTARAGASGTAYSFCDETEKGCLKSLERVTGKTLTIAKHPYHSEAAAQSLARSASRGGRFGGRSFGRRPEHGRRGAEGRERRPESRTRRPEGRRQGTGSRERNTEGRGPRPEGREERTERRPQRTENRGPRPEGRRQGAEGRGPRPEYRKPGTDGDRSKKSFTGQRAEGRTPRPEHRTPSTERRPEHRPQNTDRRPPQNTDKPRYGAEQSTTRKRIFREKAKGNFSDKKFSPGKKKRW
jgi:ATP-dependent RNA helicase RhlE